MHENYLYGFSEKILLWDKCTILGSLMIFLKFCSIKGAKRYMEIIEMFFMKKIFSCTNAPIWVQKRHTLSYLLICTKDFLKILHNEKVKEVHENFVNVFFFGKTLFQGNWVIFGPKMTCPHDSGYALRIFSLILHLGKGQEVAFLKTLKYWVSVQWVSLMSWGEGVSLALVGHLSSDGVNKNNLWSRSYIMSTSLHPYFSLLCWIKLNWKH